MGDRSGANTQGSQGEMKMSVRLGALLIMPHPFYFILVSIPEIFYSLQACDARWRDQAPSDSRVQIVDTEEREMSWAISLTPSLARGHDKQIGLIWNFIAEMMTLTRSVEHHQKQIKPDLRSHTLVVIPKNLKNISWSWSSDSARSRCFQSLIMDYPLFLEDDHLLNGEGYWFCKAEFGTVRQHPAGIIVWLVCKTICHKITLVVQMGHNDLFVSATQALSCYNHLEAINVMTHNTWPGAHNSSEILVQKIEGHI